MNRISILRLIAEERERQIQREGYDEAHDDDHSAGDLALAAAAYCRRSTGWVDVDTSGTERPPLFWPWDREYWKPKTPFQDLLRAAALIVAEMERLERIRDAKEQAA